MRRWVLRADGWSPRQPPVLVIACGISDGSIHKYADAHVLLAGGGLMSGHFHDEGKSPLADLWLTPVRQAGVRQQRFAESTCTHGEPRI